MCVCVTLCLYLVGGLEHFLFSPIVGMIIQSDFHIFQRGGSTTNQKMVISIVDLSIRKVIFHDFPLFSIAKWDGQMKPEATWRLNVLSKVLKYCRIVSGQETIPFFCDRNGDRATTRTTEFTRFLHVFWI